MSTYKLSDAKPLMIAHRGLSGLERENTHAAFVAAGNRSYFGIETDVHVTADGKYVIIHDDTTTRVTGVEMTVEETDLATLRQLKVMDRDSEDSRGDLCLPTLKEYIAICKRYDKVAVLELKNRMPKECVWEIAEIIESMDYLEKTVFISFKLDNLIDLREKYPRQPAQYLVSKIEDPDALLDKLKRYHLDLDAKYLVMTEELVERIHEAGLKVNVWTVDKPVTAARMMAMGVDYITTNILE